MNTPEEKPPITLDELQKSLPSLSKLELLTLRNEIEHDPEGFRDSVGIEAATSFFTALLVEMDSRKILNEESTAFFDPGTLTDVGSTESLTIPNSPVKVRPNRKARRAANALARRRALPQRQRRA